MAKGDCVVEALMEKYDEGVTQGISQGKEDNSIEIAKRLLKRENIS